MTTSDSGEDIAMSMKSAKELGQDPNDTNQPTVLRPSDHWLGFHLHQSSAISNVGAEVSAKISGGSIDLYNRLKPRDSIEAIYSSSIVALYSALMKSYGEAALSARVRDENLDRAYEGTALLVELVTAFENRRALLGDPKRREEALQALMMRYSPVSSPDKGATG